MENYFRINRLGLSNFHQFERYSIDLDDRMTVLVGDNGSGKSSLLAALSVALGTFFKSFARAREYQLASDDARQVCYENYGHVLEVQRQYPVSVTASAIASPGLGLNAYGEISWTRSVKSADGRMDRADARPMHELSQTCARRVEEGDPSLILPIISSYGTGRLWAKKPREFEKKTQFSRQDGYKAALDAEMYEDQMSSWFFTMEILESQRVRGLGGEESTPLYSAVRRAMEICFQRITSSPSVSILYDLTLEDLAVHYVDKNEQRQRMAMRMLSDGYRTTLSMIADIAYRMAVLNPMLGERVLETPGVVLIDEVDLHLHPLWQARILDDLLDIFPNVQFVVTTHAPIVIASARKENIRVLRRGADRPVKLDDEVYGSDVSRILETVMGAHDRPETIKGQFREFYQHLSERKYAKAREVLADIERKIGSSDTGVQEAKTVLFLEEATA